MSAVTNVLLAGVGGQGVLLGSEVLAEVASLAGFAVKKSEVHGMAQRGGSVVSHLRFGAEVFSPLISRGAADYLVSFERLETLRYLDFLHAGSVVLVNRGACVLLPRAPHGPVLVVDPLKCDGCRRCLVVACPALSLSGPGKGAQAAVDAALCTGCGVCAAHCDRDAFAPAPGLAR